MDTNNFAQIWKREESEDDGKSNRSHHQSGVISILDIFKARSEALFRQSERVYAADKARTQAVLERLGLPRQRETCIVPEPPADRNHRAKPSIRTRRLLPLFNEPPSQAEDLKQKTPTSPIYIHGDFREALDSRPESDSSTSSVDSGVIFSSVDSHTPDELRRIPLIRTPDEVSPPQTPFTPVPPPLPAPSQQKRQVSRIPVLRKTSFKRPDKEAEMFNKAEHQEPLKHGQQMSRQANKKTTTTRTIKDSRKERLEPLPKPDRSLARVFKDLSSDDWVKRVNGLKTLQSLAQHQPAVLRGPLHEVVLAVMEEVRNLRSSVACAAIDTLGSLFNHLQKSMDHEVEWSGRALLLRVAQASASSFIQQRVSLALEDMVTYCSPGHVLTPLLNTGLSHLSSAVRSTTAHLLHLLADKMGVDAVLTAGPRFTPRFLEAVNKMALDKSSEVRPHGRAVLQQLCLHKSFMIQWKTAVKEQDRLPLMKGLMKANN